MTPARLTDDTLLTAQTEPSINLGCSEQTGPSSNLGPTEQIEARSKKTRGRNKSTIRLIEAEKKIAGEIRPVTGRGVGYKLFNAKLIDSMSKKDMQPAYRALKVAREDGIIPWDWIVDETRDLEMVTTWSNGAEFARSYFYRRDLWQTQPVTVEVWSEKGTVRGVLWPVLAELGVGFRVMHGFSSATCVHDVSNNGNDDRPLIALYVGDRDPSGMYMSEIDLPQRIEKYGGSHVELRRIALAPEQVLTLPSFSVEDKKNDPRYKWYKANYGNKCWELDAMDPRELRDLVRNEITSLIDVRLWQQQEELQKREKNSIEIQLRWWSLYESMKAAA